MANITTDTITKTNDGGLGSLKKDRKEVWVYPNTNVNQCTVRLVDKYMSLLPAVGPSTKKLNFYLHSLDKPNPAQWYGKNVVGRHTLCKVVKELLKSAELDGYFTNHSLRCTGTTRLFQTDVDRKIIKEYTGHVSDAVDKYQITLDAQKEHVSRVLNGNFEVKTEESRPNHNSCEAKQSFELNVTKAPSESSATCGCQCLKDKVKLDHKQDLGEAINKILEGSKSKKTKIKIEIEIFE